MAPHEATLWQVMPQSFPHDDVQSFVSWQSDVQWSLQTVPQESPTLWQSWEHPSPVHPR
jgi:hypothetical protein